MRIKLDLIGLYKIYRNFSVISTDSRKITKGAIYFALKGENFDGNIFAPQALKDGASYAVIDNPDFYIDNRTILVDNVLLTLQKLANYHIRQLNIPVLGITGTNGKTTTKELVRSVLSQKFSVLSTQGNLNNHIGVPLTILSITDEHNFAVIEMGANHPTEIDELCKITEPDFGIITNIGKAHLDGFGGFQGVITTKNELYNYLNQKGGTVFYNSDNNILTELLQKKELNKISYGSNDYDICNGKILLANPYISVRANICIDGSEASFDIYSHLIGSYNLENILAAVTIGTYFGVSTEKIKYAIENYFPANNRSQLTKTDNNTLFVDCYNANPSSTEAALNNLFLVDGEHKIAILGDMLELGDESKLEHTNILNIIREHNIEVILVGPVYSEVAKNSGYKTFMDSDNLFNWLKDNPITGSLVLLKGSRGIKLEKVLELL